MKILTILAGMVLLISGCGKHKSAAEYKAQTVELVKLEEPPPGTSNGNYLAGTADSTSAATENDKEIQQEKARRGPVSASPQPQPEWDKKIIKNGTLGLEIKDYKKFSSSLRDKISAMGGYIAQEEQSQSDFKIENSMTIKVPVDQFDKSMQQFSADVIRVNEKKISSEDVTRQYIDTKSRMDAKKAVLQRYTELLKQARNMDEILNVQSEINAIQEELEAAGGEAEYLKHASAYSTINLTYFEILDPAAAGKDKPESTNSLIQAFRTGWNGIAAIGIGLVSIWPILLGLLAVLFILRRRSMKKPAIVS